MAFLKPEGVTGTSTLTTPGNVYFIQGVEGGLIKIGWAVDPAIRMARMQAHSPVTLRLLHSEPGNGHEERDIHHRFAANRCHGEWFEPVDDLLSLIKDMKGRNEPKKWAAGCREVCVPKGRKQPPVNYGSKEWRARQKQT